MRSVVGISADVLQVIGTNCIYPADSQFVLDNILKLYAVSPTEEDDVRILKFAPFAIVTHRDTILVRPKNNNFVLGFGRQCNWSPEYSQSSIKIAVIQTLYQELDQYIPETTYDLHPVGFLHTDDRTYDRGNLGCFLRIELKNQHCISVNGNLWFVKIDKLDPYFFVGWSRYIVEYFLKCRQLSGIV